MVGLERDKKTDNVYVVTKTDSEGYHTQVSLTKEEILMLYSKIRKMFF